MVGARLLGACLIALLITGCGGSPSPSSASLEPITLLPSADPFTSAIVATKSLGTARMDVEIIRRNAADNATGQGVTVLGSGQGDATWTVGDTSYRELVNNRGVYVERPPRSGGWEQWPPGHVTGTSGFIDTLRGLGSLRELTNEGDEMLGSVPTTRYRGWLPLTPEEASLLGLSGSPAPEDREDVTVWIDGFGHAVRVDRRAKTADDEVTSCTDFTDFSVLLNVSSPSHGVTATRS